jgi:hypothetical protein
MAAEVKKEIQLELSINEQRTVVDELTEVVCSSDQYQEAEVADRLIKIPTGDGMALRCVPFSISRASQLSQLLSPPPSTQPI